LIDESVGRFHRAIIIDPQYVKAHNNLGVAYLRSGKPEAAAVEFRAALAADAKNVESWTNLAVVMIQTGRGDQAEEMLQRALALQPQHAASHYNLALVAEQRGDVETAIRHYRRFIDNSTPDQADLVAEARRRTTALEDQPAR
jgi:Tfp pilus assembly protein PilF